MAKGLDTSILVQYELREHTGHDATRTLLRDLLREDEPLALAPQVLSEFVHVVTDPRRFEHPLEISEALARAEDWWLGQKVVHALPSDDGSRLFLRWMVDHRLGRKRLLDTQLAATYCSAGIHTIVSTNARDYRVFGCFTIIEPPASPPPASE